MVVIGLLNTCELAGRAVIGRGWVNAAACGGWHRRWHVHGEALQRVAVGGEDANEVACWTTWGSMSVCCAACDG